MVPHTTTSASVIEHALYLNSIDMLARRFANQQAAPVMNRWSDGQFYRPPLQ